MWETGIENGASGCDNNYIYDVDNVKTNRVGYVPIVRERSQLSIVSVSHSSANETYEATNYDVTYYPGALRIEEDDTKPVVQVNRKDVYIEANAIGEYLYECVGEKGTTTYSDCMVDGVTYKIEGGTKSDDAILKYLIQDQVDPTKSVIIKGKLPTLTNCASNGLECSASSYYQLMYGKGSNGFQPIEPGGENENLKPFEKEKESEVKNGGPESVAELINTFVSWFGVTAYDQGEIRNGTALPKTFDKFWYVVIETGIESVSQETIPFHINEVGKYKVHFYVMDNAGNVSQGDMNNDTFYEVNDNIYSLDASTGKYTKDANGDYLKVASYLKIETANRYNYVGGNNYTPANDGEYLYDTTNDIYHYINEEKVTNDGVDEYLEIHASYYELSRGKRYSYDGTTYTEAANGNYFKLSDKYNNTATLHIIDTTKPTVGSLNLYNTKVVCEESSGVDCSKEENWKVAEDTLISINTLYKYVMDTTNKTYIPYTEGAAGDIYIFVDETKYTSMNEYPSGYVKLSSLESCSTSSATMCLDYSSGYPTATKVKVKVGTSAKAVKHYSWSNADIYFTITGGSDNSYTESVANIASNNDNSQWDHYYSRDDGNTWIKYSRTNENSMLALAAEGVREIMIKAVDRGVRIDDSTSKTATYIASYYGEGNSNNVTSTMTYYEFVDSSIYDDKLNTDYADLTADKWIASGEGENDASFTLRANLVRTQLGWNISDASSEDSAMSEKISKLIYGKPATGEGATGYKFYRDKQSAYLDRTAPTINFGEGNGYMINVFEFGCNNAEICGNGYTELGAVASDHFGGDTSREGNGVEYTYDINNSLFISDRIDAPSKTSNYGGVKETLSTTQRFGGLSGDHYAMSGTSDNQKIIDIYSEERIYVIYGDDESGTFTIDLSDSLDPSGKIPSSLIDAEGKLKTFTKDLSYTIVYSVIDKAGNEAAYISRGVIFSNLVKPIEVNTPSSVDLEEVENNTYMLKVEQGDNVEDIVNNLSVTAGDRTSYITQTIYYNDALVVENGKYNQNIHKNFTTDVPGTYEITYSLRYRYYDEDSGLSEMIESEQVKLIIEVEATPPITVNRNSTNYTNFIALIGLVAGAIFIGLLSLGKRRR